MKVDESALDRESTIAQRNHTIEISSLQSSCSNEKQNDIIILLDTWKTSPSLTQLSYFHSILRVAVPLCGGNIDPSVLSSCIEKGLALDGRLVRIVITVDEKSGGVAQLISLLATAGAR